MDEDLKRIAGRIRSWRDEAGLTLQQLGDQSGVSASTIHKIENLQTVPTIAVLLKVANGLDRRPSELLAEAEAGKRFTVQRAGDRQRVAIEGRARLEHLAGQIPRSRLDVWRIELEPGAGSHDETWVFPGEIVLLVESGELEYELSGEVHKVGPADSIHFDTAVAHDWVVTGDRPASLLIFALLPERHKGDLLAQLGFSPDARNGSSRGSAPSPMPMQAERRDL